MYTQRFEPMSVGQIIDRAFRLYRSNFIRFVAIVAIIQVPIALIQYAVSPTSVEYEQTDWQSHGGEEFRFGFQSTQGAGVSVVVTLLFLVAQLLCMAALTKGVSESYLGNQVTVGQAYKTVLPRLFTLILAVILLWLIFAGVGVIGMVAAFAIPVLGIIAWLCLMIFLAVRVLLTVQTLVVERCGPYKSIKRSWALTARNFWRAFGLLLLLGLIIGVVMLLFFLVAGLVMRDARFLFTPGGSLTVWAINTALQILLTPIGACALILLYYDLRIRKEGFDLQMLAQSLGSTVQEAPEHGVPPVQY
jgi:hypothetical protein